MVIKILKRVFSAIFGLLCIGLILASAVEVLSFRVRYDVGGVFLGLFCITLLSLLASSLLSSSFQEIKWKQHSMKAGLFLIFAFYCLILLNLLFISRHIFFEYAFSSNIKSRIATSTNFIPFHTMISYLKNSDNFESTVIYTNIIGNLLAFAPMGFFLPLLFQKLKNFLPFACVMVLTITVIELIQFITNLGIMDIDDLILNLCGAIFAFYLCKLPFLKKLFQRFHWIS
ncbi:VanZ family protein [Lachnoclostridium sp.]|uniref:VanZ family protein n=1 Tax=Lachnoclostridium sp. TaxID=2028282 RepID=UPI0028974101|nr:VanZ family protein [Lachnoclostridium sp.]